MDNDWTMTKDFGYELFRHLNLYENFHLTHVL